MDKQNLVLETILARRSCRSFTPEKIPIAQIETLIQAARYAPSGRNMQSWKFTALQNQDKITALYTAVAKVLGRENYSFYKAPLVILPSNDRESPWAVEDNACALQNIFLCAHSMGLGSLWVNQLQNICDREEIRPLLDDLGIPSHHILTGIALVGHSAKELPSNVEKKSEYVIID